ncbi:SDR family oxidoreductase [Hydrogenophaga sp.]|uniref:SDR family oxidoreductase n=1 Tax=Hydrogenophaga sp. TaxID=1904254 RepID=UPI002636CD3E|nr:SDR family oxidoreductase [Hydrogenophaga sp.]MCW5653322.1 SDR family oxidoreductase [Hydrogenophaga sp.]
MSIRFDGRVAIITGAGAGLGRSHALLLAARGAKVVVNDPGPSRRADNEGGWAADDVVAEIRAAGGEAVANHDSIADMAGAQRLVDQAVRDFGRLDIVVNNAGILRDRTFGKLDMNDWDAVVKVHLSGTAYVTRAAWPLMQEQRYGRVVFTTSNSGLYGNFGQSNYSAAKMGMVGLMNTLKQEGGKYNIRVNTIAPVAMTGMTEGVMPADIAPHFKPEHVSAAVALLCSEAFEESGVICSAAAGHYATVRVACTSGVQLDPAEIASPEDLLARWGEISDEGRMRAFPNAGAETIAILEDIQQLAVS